MQKAKLEKYENKESQRMMKGEIKGDENILGAPLGHDGRPGVNGQQMQAQQDDVQQTPDQEASGLDERKQAHSES